MKRIHRARFAGRFLLAALFWIVPAFAQMDFSGTWAPVPDEDSVRDPLMGEFIGLPLSRAASLRAQAWNASIYTLPEWQCRPDGAVYMTRAPFQVRIWKEVDPDTREIVAFHAEDLRATDSPYYMDGRAHPSQLAPHTWGGFSTAEFEGDMLKITTTHLKENTYRRNGVPSSDQATLTQYWIRRGDILTWVIIAYDPVYLTEPMIRTTEHRLVLPANIPPYPCTVAEEVDRPAGVVPSYLPGQNPFLDEFTKKYNLPPELTRGGAEYMYPEAARKMTRAANNN
jgi:hypothetical protein